MVLARTKTATREAIECNRHFPAAVRSEFMPLPHAGVSGVGLSLQLRPHRLIGSVIKASTSTVEDPGFESRLRRDFLGVESYQ